MCGSRRRRSRSGRVSSGSCRLQCDEYPYASTKEGSAKGDNRFSVRLIDGTDNETGGRGLDQTYTLNRILDGDAFYMRSPTSRRAAASWRSWPHTGARPHPAAASWRSTTRTPISVTTTLWPPPAPRW
ncbi:NucA/NucB deoxyribonuclease domain-containing protein [Streptomyces sp. NBC_01176]|uniref:NucA/NucB deoxyribonuclease domain-containing protein n=1 Tax=Streptomyces sp. NBC_01176 TaxID=2903760 RepID=UPI003867E55A|nr:NucA/NucB deoxyribonuclease domain-containing protein [Streptomyces sp. NBC_01176]WSS89958.1 NucA/NucB deoxyribonuclease domain-containing protein [Streptomyces sp. NBC_01176]